MNAKRKSYACYNLPPKIRIAITIANSPEGYTLTELEKKLKIPRQLIRYHLPTLIKMGLVITQKKDNKTIYIAQKVFSDDDVFSSLINCYSNIIDIVSNNIKYVDNGISKEEVLKNNLKLFLDLLTIGTE